MGKSEAWDDIRPTIRENTPKNTCASTYITFPKKIVDILIDACEQNFMGKWYDLVDVRRFCKKYLKDKNYTFNGSESIIEKVVSYFKINRQNIAIAREIYSDLVAEVLLTWDDFKSLPGGICNKVRYILALEHYRSNKESIAPWENQE